MSRRAFLTIVFLGAVLPATANATSCIDLLDGYKTEAQKAAEQGVEDLQLIRESDRIYLGQVQQTRTGREAQKVWVRVGQSFKSNVRGTLTFRLPENECGLAHVRVGEPVLVFERRRFLLFTELNAIAYLDSPEGQRLWKRLRSASLEKGVR